jgi:pyruvate formate lyase activating enzyme
MIEAQYWTAETDQRVRCFLCPHQCRIYPGRRGLCQIRENRAGVLYALTYNRISVVHMDPIEKKPLYHFFPGKEILSVGSVGCNLKCQFCQNWEISQTGFVDNLKQTDSQKIVSIAQSQGSIGIAYTYNEPFIWWEFVRETSEKAKKVQLKNVLVTNGYVNSQPLLELLPYIDAMNIDLKAMDDDFYRSYCGGSLTPVLETIELSYQKKVHIEITNLLVTGLNHTPEHLHRLVDFVASISPDIPLHFSRYFPAHRMETPATDPEVLLEAYKIARGKLHFVYLGNYYGTEGQTSYCSQCGKPLITRTGYRTSLGYLENAHCQVCGTPFPLVDE